MKKHIEKKDILSFEDFAKTRSAQRKKIIDLKKNRRVHLGKDVTVYFENYDTLLWQIQEMLHVEKGGDEQMADELAAYNPLVPQGQELVATVMIEIEDPVRRKATLHQLGNFEDHLALRFSNHTIKGQPEQDTERTNEQGKTSAVHFIHWSFTPQQITQFSTPGCDVIVECTHPNYSCKALLPEEVRQALIKDFEG